MTITVRLPRILKMLKHCLQDEINKPVIGYITWIVFINIALWRIRGDDDVLGMDEGDECDYMYNEYQNEKVHHWEKILITMVILMR